MSYEENTIIMERAFEMAEEAGIEEAVISSWDLEDAYHYLVTGEVLLRIKQSSP